MADTFDPYRGALVVETETVWPDAYDHLDRSEKRRIENVLHADPANCSDLEYVRLHTGFCRVITVTPADLARAQVTA
jgi:hypothetical protein